MASGLPLPEPLGIHHPSLGGFTDDELDSRFRGNDQCFEGGIPSEMTRMPADTGALLSLFLSGHIICIGFLFARRPSRCPSR